MRQDTEEQGHLAHHLKAVNIMMKRRLTLAVSTCLAMAWLLASCGKSQDKPAGAPQAKTSHSASAPQAKRPEVRIDAGVLVNLGDRVAAVYGQDDAVCHDVIEPKKCKILRVSDMGTKAVALAGADGKSPAEWTEAWTITQAKTDRGMRYVIRRPNGFEVRPAPNNYQPPEVTQ
jgi:hypothetical protein